ncbi:hypothetical protein ACU686_09755 [Yinghuangia aomiensis]
MPTASNPLPGLLSGPATSPQDKRVRQPPGKDRHRHRRRPQPRRPHRRHAGRGRSQRRPRRGQRHLFGFDFEFSEAPWYDGAKQTYMHPAFAYPRPHIDDRGDGWNGCASGPAPAPRNSAVIFSTRTRRRTRRGSVRSGLEGLVRGPARDPPADRRTRSRPGPGAAALGSQRNSSRSTGGTARFRSLCCGAGFQAPCAQRLGVDAELVRDRRTALPDDCNSVTAPLLPP